MVRTLPAPANVANSAYAVAAVCGQLGYRAKDQAVRRRFAAIERDADHAVVVACGPARQVVGWVHVHGKRLLELEPHVEIGGLTVNAEHRGRGVGRALMGAAERWALGQGYATVLLRSRADREETHRFYEGVGYTRVSSQLKFHKRLANTSRWLLPHTPAHSVQPVATSVTVRVVR